MRIRRVGEGRPLMEQIIDTKLGRLHVEVDGEGPAAVLWHSLFVDSSTWSRLRGLLRDDRRLVLIDGPGHGKSGFPATDFDLAACAEAVIQVLSTRWACGSRRLGG